MIIKIIPNTYQRYIGDRKLLLKDHEDEWHKCILPHRLVDIVQIEICDIFFDINFRHIELVINDNRHNYDVCSNCKVVVEKGVSECTACGSTRDNGYLRPLLTSYGGSSPDLETIPKGSISSTFGI